MGAPIRSLVLMFGNHKASGRTDWRERGPTRTRPERDGGQPDIYFVTYAAYDSASHYNSISQLMGIVGTGLMFHIVISNV